MIGRTAGRRTLANVALPHHCQSLSECDREERIPIVDQEAFARQEAIVGIRDVAAHLAHPGGVGLRGDAGDLDSARRQLDEEEHGKSRQAVRGPDVDGEKVRGGEDVPVGLQELRPSGLFTRSGAGSRPCARRMLATVPRPT